MRKSVRLIILLLVVAIIYFGYSAWMDSVAIYNIGGNQLGSSTWNKLVDEMMSFTTMKPEEFVENFFADKDNIFLTKDSNLTGAAYSNVDFIAKLVSVSNETSQTTYKFAGFMAANSLLKTLLDPFKMVLVGGVFALFIPLTKQLVFGTIIGLKNYLKNRQSNVLYNYQKTINYVADLKTKLAVGNHDDVKASYATFSGLAFKPEFLTNMMNEICAVLIKERDLTIFADPAQIVENSLKEMYEKERMRSINGRGDEMFFDLKRGYEYSAKGSKYSIAYYKSQQEKADNALGWKIYSLEIFKFNFFLFATLIPALILSGLVGGLVNGLVSNLPSDVRVLLVAAFFFIPWVLLTILVHGISVFNNKAYAQMKHVLIKPAIIYYLIYLLTFITISAGIVGLVKVGDISLPGSGGSIWNWFSALGYLILSTSLIFYVLATLVDSYKTYKKLTTKLMIDGIILPLFAWSVSTIANFMALYGKVDSSIQNIFAAINSVTLVGFWIYLSISAFLINNLVSPSVARELRKVIEADALKSKFKKKAKN